MDMPEVVLLIATVCAEGSIVKVAVATELSVIPDSYATAYIVAVLLTVMAPTPPLAPASAP
jgi:hypothetical protein